MCVKLNIKNLTTAVFLGMLLFGVMNSVNAQQALPRGGDSFESAVEIQLGEYVTDHSIPRDAPEYFKLPIVKAGQLLMVEVTNPPAGRDILSNTVLYDKDRAILLPGYVNPIDNLAWEGATDRYSWMPNSEKSSYAYYMSIGGGDITSTAKGTRYKISIEDRFDIRSQTDAGDKIETSMNITEGEYKGYLSGVWGTDIKDFYKMRVEKGKKVLVEITPPSNRKVWCKIYDENRNLIGEKYPPNPGAIVKATADMVSAGDAFIEIATNKDSGLVSYTFNIATERLPPEEKEEKEEKEEGITLPDEEMVPPEEELFEEGPNWTLISTIIGIIVAIGIVIYFLSKRKLLP